MKLGFKDYLPLLICIISGIGLFIAGIIIFNSATRATDYLETIGGISSTIGLGGIAIFTSNWVLHKKL